MAHIERADGVDGYWVLGDLAAQGYAPAAALELAALPLEPRLSLPDGTRPLRVHAAPGTDDGDGIQPGFADAK